MARSAISRMLASADAASGWALLDPDAIPGRPAGDLRPPVPEHVVTMAETIATVGLLHPVVLDAHKRLLAGRHRIEAFRLLRIPDPEQRVAALADLAGVSGALPPRLQPLAERVRALDLAAFARHHPQGTIPARIRSDLDAERDPESARKAEVAENDIRRDFTRDEILAYAAQLRAAGFDDQPGRPRKGTRALVPALVGIVGKSRRTVLRILAEQCETGSGEDAGPTRAAAIAALRRRISAAQREAERLDLEAAVALLKQVDAAIERA